MPAKIQKIPSLIWTHIRSPRIQHFIQEDTRRSWARVVESQATVPEAYKEFFERHFTGSDDFPYTVLAPSRSQNVYWRTEKLVCNIGSRIYILERRGDTFDERCYPIAGISYVETRMVLLDSCIKITGVTNKDVSASSTIYFNSVTDYLFTPILNKIRTLNFDSSLRDLKPEQEKFDHWVRSNYKFMNYARNSLVGGERVIHSILQPEIRTEGVKILGRTYYKIISPAHVSILTDRELIMIREEVRHRGKDRYGGIWDYIPLNKITDLSLRDANGGLLVLSIQLPEDTRLEFLFQESARKEVNELLHRFKELTP